MTCQGASQSGAGVVRSYLYQCDLSRLPKLSATLTLNTKPVRVLRVLREDLRAHVPQRPGRQNVGDERGGGGGGGVRGLVRGRFVFASPCALSTS